MDDERSSHLKGEVAVDQLIQSIAERTGISVEQARQATNMVLGFLKEKLPEPIASHVESLLGSHGSAGSADQVSDVLGGLGDLFK